MPSDTIRFMYPPAQTGTVRRHIAPRPMPVAMMAGLQFAKAAFMLIVAAIPLLGAKRDLASLPAIRDLLFLASHGKDPRGVLVILLGVYAAVIGSGLWRLKRWARNSLVFSSGMMLVFWLAHHDFGTQILLMPAIHDVEKPAVDILLLLDAAIFAYLKLHTETRRSFPRKKKRAVAVVSPS